MNTTQQAYYIHVQNSHYDILNLSNFCITSNLYHPSAQTLSAQTLGGDS